MSQKFKTQIRIKFREADPAQIMYFANILSLAHDCFEEFIVAAGYTYQEWFSPKEHIIPIRHVDADYKSPFFPGETYDVFVSVEHLSNTSFKMKYQFEQNGRLHATVHMVHAVLDPKTKEKMPLPEKMKQRLSPYLEVPHGK